MMRIIAAVVIAAAILSSGILLVLGFPSLTAVAQEQQRFLIFTTGVPSVNQGSELTGQSRWSKTLDEVRVKPGLESLVARVPGEAVSDLARQSGVIEVSLEVVPEPADDPVL
jgi:hypothetical protein